MQNHGHAATNIRRWVLAWLLMAALAAVASPLIRPHALEVACSGAGHAVLLEQTADGPAPVDTPALDCPLCLPADVPPPALARAISFQQPALQAQQRAPWRLALLPHRQLPPARAPPFFSLSHP